MHNKFPTPALSFLMLFSLILSGCDAINDLSNQLNNKKENKTGESVAQYSGLNTAVLITSENGKNVINTGLGAQSSSSTLYSLLSAASVQKVSDDKPLPVRESVQQIARIIAALQDGFTVQEANFTGAELTVNGSCGGTFNASGGQTDSLISFNNYCDTGSRTTLGITLNGSVNHKRDTDPETGTTRNELQIDQLSLTGRLPGYTDDENLTVTGTLIITHGPQESSALMNFVLLDNISQQQVKYENYTIKTVREFNPVYGAWFPNTTLNGRVYTASIGYIDIVTDEPLLVDPDGGVPYSVQITIKGAQASFATLRITGSDTYTLQINQDEPSAGLLTEIEGLRNLIV